MAEINPAFRNKYQNLVDDFLQKERSDFLGFDIGPQKRKKHDAALTRKRQRSKDKRSKQSKKQPRETDFVSEFLLREVQDFLENWHPFHHNTEENNGKINIRKFIKEETSWKPENDIVQEEMDFY